MERSKITERLCWYDPRNPNHTTDEEEVKDHEEMLKQNGNTCYCDNCFYGRTELANELLKLIDK
jgi:hypothetical protein